MRVTASLLSLAMLAPLSALGIVARVDAQTIQVNKDNRTIAITTTDEATAPADTAEVSIGFQVFGNDSDSTYAEGSRVSNAILTNVKATGVTEQHIRSTGQNLQPVGEDDKLRFAKGIRFSLTQSWRVTVPAKEAASLLQAAISSGANQSGDIQWTLQKRDALQAEAAGKALEHARAIAERMAAGLHGKLGTLVYASNQAPSRFPPGVLLQTEAAMPVAAALRKAAPLAIVPDAVTESATVYAVFALE